MLYCDSDWAGDPESKISVAGVIVYLLGVPICWRSKAQKGCYIVIQQSLVCGNVEDPRLRRVLHCHTAKLSMWQCRRSKAQKGCYIVIQQSLVCGNVGGGKRNPFYLLFVEEYVH
jgi:hypothetical protein